VSHVPDPAPESYALQSPVDAEPAGTEPLVDAARAARLVRAREYVLVRHRHNWELLIKFGIVGGSGFIVNLILFALAQALLGDGDAVLVNLPGTEFNVRAYHGFSMLAFLGANISNYLLNRGWTFGSRGTAHWLREYIPFLLVGLGAQALVLAILTSLQHNNSPLELESTLLAQAIAIIVVTPLSFLGNKLWTFRRVRGRHRVFLDTPNA